MKCLIVLVVLAVVANASPVKDADLCLDCKTLFGDVKTRLVNPATAAVIETNLDKYFCNFLLIGKEQCKASTKMFIGAGLGFMSTLIDPKIICTMLMYCQPTPPPSPQHAPEFTAHLAETMDLAKRFMELSKKDNDVDLCVDCKTLFTDVKARLADPATITQLSAAVNKFTCDLLPVAMGRATCQAVVNGAITSGLSILKELIDPNMICAMLMYCQPPPVQMYFHHDDAHLLGRFFELSNKKSAGGDVDLCLDCKTLFKDVKARLINPATVTGIVGQVDKYVCNLLPIGKKMCSQMATQMIQTGMGLLSQLIDANMICTMLMYCKPTPPPSPTLYFTPTLLTETSNADVDLCVDCTTLFADVKTRLVNPTTTAAITGMIEKYSCALLPVYKTECNVAVSTVVSMMGAFMANLIDAKVICTFLMYCTA